MSNLQHIKGSRTRVLNTFPVKDFGNDGDIVISRIKGKGVFLCSKAGGMWYAANQMEELKKVGKARADSLSVNKLQVNGMLNAELLSDKFLINENGVIKYRTGEEVVGDLSIPINNIAYKTAYCSLGQYSDKDSCESNGGTWYYSENDSHDSISSTAENQLLTVGQSIGTVDAESALLYDGSTLEIKYNSDYDDNWQTSAQTELLKLSYDSSNNATFTVSSAGDLTLDIDGDLILDPASGINKFYFNGDTDDLCQLQVEANGATTIATSDSDGTLGHFVLDIDGKIKIDPHTGQILLLGAGAQFGAFTGGTALGASNLFLYEEGGASTDDYLNISVRGNGETSISTVDAAGADAHLTIQPDGDLILDPVSQNIIINATDKLYFDGGNETYISESANNELRIVVGDDILMTLTTSGADGNNVNFRDSSAGFTREEATFSATGIIGSPGIDDTDIDFRFSNKYRLEMTGDISNINLIFPASSGNFLLVCTTNGDHDVTNWKVYESDESAATTADVLWAGGSVPAFTSSGVDIVSFYWDATEQQAYGVASLAFATP